MVRAAQSVAPRARHDPAVAAGIGGFRAGRAAADQQRALSRDAPAQPGTTPARITLPSRDFCSPSLMFSSLNLCDTSLSKRYLSRVRTRRSSTLGMTHDL